MNIAEIVQSSAWKNFMAKLYGIGAAVVIVGALFKIMHWPGAGIMLTAGLATEAVIFFFSAFEPLHEELDWTLVYPELAGMYHMDGTSKASSRKDPSKSVTQELDDMLSKAKIGFIRDLIQFYTGNFKINCNIDLLFTEKQKILY